MIAALVALASVAAAFLFLRHRRSLPALDEIGVAEPSAEKPGNATRDTIAAPAAPTLRTVPPRPAAPARPAEAITLRLEPVSLRISLVYATLRYRLDLAGLSGPARVVGDMIGAHASLDARVQLAPDPQALPPLHDIAADGPAALTGELQLPLEAIRVIRKGPAGFFVPLARLCLLGPDGLVARRVFSIGTPGALASEPLAPIRLDGPRMIATLAAREIEAARGLGLDPVRAAV